MRSLAHPRDWYCWLLYCKPTNIRCVLWRTIMNWKPMLIHSQVQQMSALRNWECMQQGANVSILNFRTAYLQVHVEKSPWPYQIIMFKGKRYCLTRLGFGLNMVPLTMCSVFKAVLAQMINRATLAYTDNIHINKDVASAESMRKHLKLYRLTSKSLEKLQNGARVLGLEAWREHGQLL